MPTDRQKLLESIKGNPALVSRLLAFAEPCTSSTSVVTPDDAIPHFLPLLAGQPNENLACLALNRRKIPLACEVLSIGNDHYCIVCPRQILRWALLQGKSGASAIVIAHNHPSGDSTPSRPDVKVTTELHKACQAVKIPLLDHLVICDDHNWVSMRERGYF